MPKLKLQNMTPVALHNKRPTEVFYIDVDDDGVPLDRFWRDRFAEGAVDKGYLKILSDDAAAVAESETKKSNSAASPATAKK